jgi:hypothetical protein
MFLLKVNDTMINLDNILTADLVDAAVVGLDEPIPDLPFLNITFVDGSFKTYMGGGAKTIWKALENCCYNIVRTRGVEDGAIIAP